jgi:hypothetical protein
MPTSSETPLLAFGQWLMTEVRDAAIIHWRMMLNGKMKGAKAEELQRLLANVGANERAALQAVVPKVVDTTLHYLLAGLEQPSNIMLGVQSPAGDVVSLRQVSDGLAGELYSKEGWIARFSKEAGA